ncbi:MAG: redoxin domain-containing protein, partial [Thermoanaerobaculia bacterium]|nr:redoxin domain-containing protein [Thermoanaerobaculia bacterium]
MLRRLACLVFLLLPPASSAQSPTDLDGNPFDPFAVAAEPETVPAVKAIVLAFAGPECPISNRLAPDLIRVVRDFEKHGVRFYLVYPEVEVDGETARRHAAAYGYAFPALLDHGRVLVEKAQATILSEVALFSPAGELLYRGRINDRVLDFGTLRPEPSREDLRLALDDVLAGRPVAEPRTQAIGCIIRPDLESRRRP